MFRREPAKRARLDGAQGVVVKIHVQGGEQEGFLLIHALHVG